MNSQIKILIEKTIEMVKDIPEPYRVKTFEILLQGALSENSLVISEKPKKNSSISKIDKGYDLDGILKSNYDWSEKKIQKLPSVGQYLSILRIVEDEFDCPGLTATDLRIILSQKYRITKTINAISMGLMQSVGKYVDRIHRGNKYIYRTTGDGREQLKNILQKSEGV